MFAARVSAEGYEYEDEGEGESEAEYEQIPPFSSSFFPFPLQVPSHQAPELGVVCRDLEGPLPLTV